MFAVCLNFPYEHQINRIYPGFLSKFLEKLKLLAKESGCEKYLYKESYIYFFDTEKIASVFFASRFLLLVLQEIEKVSDSIHEYRIIVEEFPSDYKDSLIAELLLQLQNGLLSYNQCIIGSRANRYFKKYFYLSKSKNSAVNVFSGSGFLKSIDIKKKIAYKSEIPTVFMRVGQSYLVALYNFFLMYPLCDEAINAFPDCKKTYFETRPVITYFSKNRFNTEWENYFIDAFHIYAKIHIKRCKAVHKVSNLEICVENENEKHTSEIKKIQQIIGEHRLFILEKPNFGIDEIPNDLLELIYILLHCIKFVFFNEIENFFFYLTKSHSYEEVLEIMCRYGIVLKKYGIYSYNSDILALIGKKLKTKKSKLDAYIARFLFALYESASLDACISLQNVFDMLKVEYSESFIIDVFFNLKKYDPLFPLNSVSENSVSGIALLEKYNTAYNLQNEGNFVDAFSIAKELSQSFHKYSLSGEYKNLFLLAFLYLKNNNINDSLTYYAYALEIAKTTKNSFFLCEALFFLGVVYFLKKDFQNAFMVLQELGKCISLSFRQEWKVLYLFMQGRIYIELGQANLAETFFKLAKDFANLYFPEFKTFCATWYARACIYGGKVESGRTLLKEISSSESLLFLLEVSILFPSADYSDEEVFDLKKKYDVQAKQESDNMNGFSFIENVAWINIYKMPYMDRMFSQFYSYYIVALSKKESRKTREENLEKLSNLALEGLYAKDGTSSLWLYLCYEAHLKFDGEKSGMALGFLSKACRVMQQSSMLMYEADMRDKFMKQNIWNAKLFKIASENKLI